MENDEKKINIIKEIKYFCDIKDNVNKLKIVTDKMKLCKGYKNKSEENSICIHYSFKECNNENLIEEFKNKEIIICSAILFDDGCKYYHQPKNIETGFIICGHRHCSIYSSIQNLKDIFQYNNIKINTIDNIMKADSIKIKYNSIEKIEGFLSSYNNFYNREEAKKIAIKSGQVNENNLTHNYLFSEDLY